ncbi:MAG: Fe-S cluster assembly protein SufD [Rhodospirillales bacterium]
MSVETMTTAKSFADLYRAEKAGLPGAELPWLASLREDAANRLLDLGLPTARMEQWRYTPALANRLGELALSRAETAATATPLLGDGAAAITVRQGHVSLDRPGGPALRIATLAEMLARQDAELEARLKPESGADSAVAAINLALLQDGLFIAAKASEAPQVVEIAYEGDGSLANLRLDLTLESGAEVVLLERFAGRGLTNQVARLRLAQGARLTHVLLLEEDSDATHLAESQVSLARDADYRGYVFFAGTGLTRRAIDIDLLEPGATAVLDGAYLLDGRGHGDLTSHIRHAAPDTTSKETVKGVLGGRSRQVFRGKITVEEGASRADGRMANKTLLLNDQVEIDSKPELMIFHDDVQCAHGATSGKLDEQALFYLRSRGLPLPLARKLLLRSFLEETLERLSDPTLSALVAARLERRLQEIAQ